jgi:hypothetical protein
MDLRGSRGIFALLVFLCSGSVSAQTDVVAAGCVSGEVTAEPADEKLGDWEYTLSVSWATGAPQALSHLDLLLGLSACGCVCSEFSFGAADTAGTSDGTSRGRRCTVFYAAEFECKGDPSIPGDEGPIVKFEPLRGTCEPGPTGSGVFVFYSDWPPAEIAKPFNGLLIKYGTRSCSGPLAGVLPTCRCATATESTSWGGVKRMFR